MLQWLVACYERMQWRVLGSLKISFSAQWLQRVSCASCHQQQPYSGFVHGLNIVHPHTRHTPDWRLAKISRYRRSTLVGFSFLSIFVTRKAGRLAGDTPPEDSKIKVQERDGPHRKLVVGKTKAVGHATEAVTPGIRSRAVFILCQPDAAIRFSGPNGITSEICK